MTTRFIPNPMLEQAVKADHDLNAALLEETQKIAAAAQGLAPVDTGALRDSITAQAAEPGVTKVVVDVSYAAFVEYGTSNMSPVPYLRPAGDAAR